MNIELRDNLKTWTAACVLLVILTISVAIASFIIPLPSVNKAEVAGKLAVKHAKDDLTAREKEIAELQATDPGVWEGLTEAVTPQILQAITVVAKAQGVTLKSFRPQNPVADGDISRSNFVVLVEGSYPKIVAFTKAVDSASSRLGVSQVQIASIDQATDSVNATIGVIAYIRQPEVKKGRTTDVATNKSPNADSVKNETQAEKELSNDSSNPTSIPKESN